MCDKPKDQNLPYNLNCKHLQKELQIIQKNCQAYAIYFPFFLITKELCHMHKAM
jgi:hypothetical protein